MHTKPISTKVIASYEATLTSGFANLGSGEFNKVIDILDLKRELTPIEHEMVEAVNGDNPAIDVFNIIESIIVNSDKAHSEGPIDDMDVVFQAAVVYHYMRQRVPLTKNHLPQLASTYYEWLEFSDGVEDKLKAHFDAHCVNTDPRDSEYPNSVKLIDSIRDDSSSFFANARLIPDFPSLLLPSKKDEEAKDFQEHYQHLKNRSVDVDDRDLLQQEKLLPVLYIIAKLPERTVEAGMTREEKRQLIEDLSAAKRFYTILSELPTRSEDFRKYGSLPDKHEEEDSEESSKKKKKKKKKTRLMSEFIQRTIDSIPIEDLEAQPIEDLEAQRIEDLEAQPIYRFLINFYLVQVWWELLVPESIHADMKQEFDIKASSFFDFCSAFHYDRMLDEDQVQVLKKIVTVLLDSGYRKDPSFKKKNYDSFKKMQEKLKKFEYLHLNE